MAWTNIVNQVGKSFVGLAAGGMCLSPLQAQQPASRAEPAGQTAENAGTPLAVDKEVTLSPDGSFRATVITRAGNLVPGAHLTFTPEPANSGSVVRATTGATGITLISNFKPGLYRVHVDATQGTYDGTLQAKSSVVAPSDAMTRSARDGILQVKSQAGAQGAAVPPPLVVFVLNQAANNEDRVDDPGMLNPGNLARGRLLGAAALLGGATAIAVPLALQGGGHPTRRASP
jgi:hypothetical protein